ncbi:MAG: type II secretion system protein [Gemmatimonadota bacterium]
MRARRGMTLMELIVGLVLTGVMAAMGTATFGSIMDHRRVIKESTVTMERAVALRETLRLWLTSGTVQIRQGGGPRGLRGAPVSSSTGGVSEAAAAGDEIRFTTSAPNPAMAPTVQIRLFVDGDTQTPETGLTMEYRATNQTPLQRREVDASIGTLVVEFLDARTKRWFPSTEASTISVTALRVTLLPADGVTVPAILQLPLIFPVLGGAQ